MYGTSRLRLFHGCMLTKSETNIQKGSNNKPCFFNFRFCYLQIQHFGHVDYGAPFRLFYKR